MHAPSMLYTGMRPVPRKSNQSGRHHWRKPPAPRQKKQRHLHAFCPFCCSLKVPKNDDGVRCSVRATFGTRCSERGVGGAIGGARGARAGRRAMPRGDAGHGAGGKAETGEGPCRPGAQDAAAWQRERKSSPFFACFALCLRQLCKQKCRLSKRR